MCARSAKQPRFQPGDQVRMRAEPSAVGVVLAVIPSGDHGFVYPVSFSDTDQRYVIETDLLPRTQIAIGEQVLPYHTSLDDLRREILLAKLCGPHGESLCTPYIAGTDI